MSTGTELLSLKGFKPNLELSKSDIMFLAECILKMLIGSKKMFFDWNPTSDFTVEFSLPNYNVHFSVKIKH